MNLARNLKQEQLDFAWWVEIVSEQPHCIYYFGPFISTQEAQVFLPGYVQDIEQEGCQKIWSEIKQCQPQELTLFEEEGRNTDLFKSMISKTENMSRTFI